MSKISKALFSLQLQARDPLVTRRLTRTTGLSSSEVRERIEEIRSPKDPFYNAVRQAVKDNEDN